MRFTRKNGDPVDMLIVVISIFFLAVVFLTYWYFTTSTASALQSTPIYINETVSGVQSLRDLGEKGASQGFVMLFGAVVLGMMISSFMVRIHPAFIFLYIILLIVNVVLAVFLGNAYGLMTSQEPYLSAAAANPVIDTVMRNIVKIALVSGALSMIVVFAKTYGGEPTL
jgi:hypothetical protein